ncbi:MULTISPECIES: GntR family transcriptional regulator [Microbacterium]|jgi:DNA-binding GntR family transcriptional regulator|uniref:GntR family transcriptional regulator n=1 Tax=Microbacterium TaxID=33882 RepID=UPI002859D5E3|nr:MULTISPECIES: GntR family transcriptional regulator [Microbacterium]MDR7114105.1 DNA-binding GntR family transcriptional regulator [Microbacterium trichothecenolyticum]MDT0144817.1 GntR family transcriptional regulator [Microbacterium sp. PRC9]
MTGPELRSVVRLSKQPSIRDTVTRALRSAIISGEMQPGRVYSAPSLGEQFGVSATPIREAMLDLVREGLVIALPNRGFQVTEVSPQDLYEVTELRLMLEPPAIERATPFVPAEALPELRRQAAAIVEGAETGDLIGYLTADSDFHLALLQYAGNTRLTELVASLRSQTRLFGLSALAEQGRLTASAREHDEMLDAIEAGDAVRARELVHAHIEHVLTDWSGYSAAGAAPAGTPRPA